MVADYRSYMIEEITRLFASSISDKSILIYDSVYSTVNDETVEVIKSLFEITNETKIDLKKMQKQLGSQDCGLFAIAVSTALLNGLDIANTNNILPERNEKTPDFLLYNPITNSISYHLILKHD